MTALFSINLLIAGASNVPIGREADTIFSAGPAALLGGMSLGLRRLIVSAILVLAVKLLLDAYFRTKSGLLLRAVGDNSTLVTTLAKNMGRVKILGLALSNGLVALAGGVVCQADKSCTSTMGTGQLVYGLAAVIIGEVIFGKVFRNFALKLVAVAIGAILYYLVYQVVIWLGLNTDDMKLITALIVAAFLAIPYWKGKYAHVKVPAGDPKAESKTGGDQNA